MGKRKRSQVRKAIADESKGMKGGELGGKKITSSWTSAQEIIVLDELLKLAKEINSWPLGNSSVNWEHLAVAIGERLDRSLSKTQIYEKVRRLKERYIRTEENFSDQKLNSFRDEDDENIYKLSGKIWGVCGAQQIQIDEEEDGSPCSNMEKGTHDKKKAQSYVSLSDDAEVEKIQEKIVPLSHPKEPEQQLDIKGVGEGAEEHITIQRQSRASYKQASSAAGRASLKQASNDAGKTSHEQTKPNQKIASPQKNEGNEGGIKTTADVVYSVHQALVNNIQESCMTVLQDMETKFLTLLSNTIRRSRSPWMGVICAPIPSAGLLLQDPVAGDNMMDRCRSLTEVNKSVAFESLSEQWLQQHLQELKLTSLKLQLMLDECKKEKEKLEKQVLKS